jgi:large subunit ribosomal protein L15
MPLIRKIPKRGFNNKRFAGSLAVINVAELNAFDKGSSVDEAALREKGLVKGSFDGVKVLGAGELKTSLTVKASKFSKSAVEKIEKAGGSVTLI